MGTFGHFFPTFREKKSVFSPFLYSTIRKKRFATRCRVAKRFSFVFAFWRRWAQERALLRKMPLSVEHPLLNRVSNAVFVVGQRDEIGHRLHFLDGIGHRDAHAGETQHGEIVETVAKGDELFARQIKMRQQARQRMVFAHTGRHDFEEERRGARNRQRIAEDRLHLFLQLYQQIGIAGDQALRRTVFKPRSLGDEIGHDLNGHLIDAGFLVEIGRIVARGEDAVATIGE